MDSFAACIRILKMNIFSMLFLVTMEVNSLLFLCITLPILARFLPELCVLFWLRMKGRLADAESLRLEISDLKEQQAEISMMDEFAKHAKVSRRINAKTKTLESINQQQIWIRLKVFWCARIALYVMSFLILVCYQSEPILVFDIQPYHDNSLVYIVAYVMAFPTGMPGAIGLPIGMLVLNRIVNKFFDLFEPSGSPQKPISDPVD